MTRSSPVDTLEGMDHCIVAFPKLTPWLHLAFSDGKSALHHLGTRLLRLGELPCTLVVPAGSGAEAQRTILEALIPPDARGRTTILEPADERGCTALRQIQAAIPEEVEQLLWIEGDAPFFSLPLTAYLKELHTRSWCDYTFGDGFPTGYAPQLLRREILPVLASLAESRDVPWTRTVLFDALSVDINAFDVETEAASEDYSLLRVGLVAETKADYLLCRRLVERGVTEPVEREPVEREGTPDPFQDRYRDDHDVLLQTLLQEPAIRRTLPRYYHVQVTNRITQQALHKPEASARVSRDMSRETLDRLLQHIHEETPESIVSFGYRGEPGVYPELPWLLERLEEYHGIAAYLETNGVGWTKENLRALQEKGRRVQALIVEVDAFHPETYRTLRGEGFQEALEFIERMRIALPDRVYVQATRMLDNEWELQEFFRHWSDTEGVRPLIQKYNSYAGRLPDRRVADLRPLKRVPCRHLEREVVVLLDGRVVRCHQDVDEEAVRGSIMEEPLLHLWEKGSGDFLAHLEEQYPELCKRCDEYYTINA